MRPFLVVCLLAIACARPPDREVQGLRVVSLVPSATEVIFALGMGDNLVGATRYCTRPAKASLVPRVGGLLDVSLEAVLGARPHVVIGSRAVLVGHFAETLSAAGVRLVPVWFETAADIGPSVLAIGEALDRRAEAMTLLRVMERDLERLAGRAARTPPIRILFVVGKNPLVVAGPGSFIGELLGRMGVENVVPSGLTAYPTWSFEQVLRSDPDVVVDGAVEAEGVAAVLKDLGLRAAVAGRVIRLGDDGVLRAGPSSARAALDLAEAILAATRGGE